MLSSNILLLTFLAAPSHSFPLHPRHLDNGHQAFFADSLNPPQTNQSATAQAPTPTSNALPSPQSVNPVLFAPDAMAAPNPSRLPTQLALSPMVAAYYPDWSAAQLPPELVDFARFDWIDFAFVLLDPETFTLKFSDTGSEDILSRLVAAAHRKQKRVKLSIGGWTGSAHFSDAVNAHNRVAFAQAISQVYKRFDLDGIDIDWEYPGEQGAAGNIHSPADTANFLLFLQLLRSLLPPQARITAATQVWPFVDESGQPMKDVSAFAQVLDWVLLMNYDVWGSSSVPGPNAPLSNACHNSSQPNANAHAAIENWTAAGFPLDQIMLGVPAYGYVSKSTATRLRTRQQTPSGVERTPMSAAHPNAQDGPPQSLRVVSEAGSSYSGQVQFNALVEQKALVRNVQGMRPAFVGAGGFERQWDDCSNTPFLRSVLSEQIITYDDPESLEMKAAYAKKAGILGVNMWDAHGDTTTWDLVDGVRRGLGVA